MFFAVFSLIISGLLSIIKSELPISPKSSDIFKNDRAKLLNRNKTVEEEPIIKIDLPTSISPFITILIVIYVLAKTTNVIPMKSNIFTKNQVL